MNESTELTINVNGELMELSSPKVMGILNVTPDSFYEASRKETERDIAERARQIVEEGADIIDIGAYSSRPDAEDISAEEEMKRLRKGLAILRRETPGAVISVDTFRAGVAAMCVEEYGAAIINDISGGQLDEQMFDTVEKLNVPYVLTHLQGTPQTMQVAPHYENLRTDVPRYFAEKIQELHARGVKDIIIDPGFGFGKTLAQNYELLRHLDDFRIFGMPVLAGFSRKSMIYKLLGCTPAEALNGTTVLNTLAMAKGAHILRVHDVKACVEAARIFNEMNKQP